MNKGFDNSKNAYILVYEKIKKKPITIIKTDNVEEMNLLENTLKIQVGAEDKEVLVDLDKFT